MRNYKMRTAEDQMNSALVTLTGLLDLRKTLDEAIENLMDVDLSLHNNDELDVKVLGAKIGVRRTKELILEVSEIISECLKGNI